MRCRVACVNYLNTAPLVEGLDKLDGLTLVPTVPSRIGEMVARGGADVGLASVVDATRFGLEILDAGMIGCDGPTLTVRVFSAVPLANVRRLHADTDSHTSVVLAQVLLAATYGVRPEVVSFDVRERVERGVTPIRSVPCDATDAQHAPEGRATSIDDAWPETVLLIGDKVATDPPPASRYPHQLDLGAAWKDRTGLPFVYAAWMCREGERENVRVAEALLDRQRRHNATRLGRIIATRAPAARWPPDLAARYIGDLLRYDLGPREREGLERFIAEAGALGLLADRSAASR